MVFKYKFLYVCPYFRIKKINLVNFLLHILLFKLSKITFNINKNMVFELKIIPNKFIFWFFNMQNEKIKIFIKKI